MRNALLAHNYMSAVARFPCDILTPAFTKPLTREGHIALYFLVSSLLKYTTIAAKQAHVAEYQYTPLLQAVHNAYQLKHAQQFLLTQFENQNRKSITCWRYWFTRIFRPRDPLYHYRALVQALPLCPRDNVAPNRHTSPDKSKNNADVGIRS